MNIPNMINVVSRRGCKDLVTILLKSDGYELKHYLFSFEFVILNCLKLELLWTYTGQQLSYRLLEFVSYCLLNKYVSLFVGFVAMTRAQFHLVIKLDSIEEFKGHRDKALVYSVTGMLLGIIKKSPIEIPPFFNFTDCYRPIVCEML